MTRYQHTRTKKKRITKKTSRKKTIKNKPFQTSIQHSYYLQCHGLFPHAPISQKAFYKALCRKLYATRTIKKYD